MVDVTLMFPIVSGVFLTLQGGATGYLGRSGGRGFASFWTIMTSSLMGSIMFVAMTKGGSDVDLAEGRREAPWYSYIGGWLGAFYVFTLATFIRQLGASRFFLICVLFQLGSAAVIDSLGALSLPQRIPTAGRISGLVLVLLGCYFVNAPQSFWNVFHKKFRQPPQANNLSADVVSAAADSIETQQSLSGLHDGISHDTSPEKDTEKAIPSISTVQTSPNEHDQTNTQSQVTPTESQQPSMWKTALIMFFPAISGVCLSLQAGCNNAMAQAYGRVFATMYSLVSAAVPMIFLFLYEHFYVSPTSVKKVIAESPWFAYLSGALGFFYVMTITFFSATLGASTLLGTVIATQVISAVVVDHFGWLGFDQRRVTVARGVGVIVMVVGVILITILH